MRLLLNVYRNDCIVVFCQENKMHLNRSVPMGFASVITPSLKGQIIAGNVIDVDKATGVTVGSHVEEIRERVLALMKINPMVAPSTPMEIVAPAIEVKEEVETKKEAEKKKPSAKATKSKNKEEAK